MEIPKQTYQYKNVNYDLEQILAFYQTNRIDTNLDCQRGYVWTPEQKQQLIDTLVFRERIPEFHVIKEAEESIFHYADGKQRITTIINFLTDELPWERSQADPTFRELFNKKSKLKFSELPDNFRYMILSTQIPMACYSNMTPASTTKLFRKLNSGTSLGEFQKGLAENISIKQYFLNDLMLHSVIPKIFSKSKIEKGNAEQALIRIMILMEKFDNGESFECSLRPPDLSKYYLDLEKATEAESWAYVEKLQHYKGIIKKFLDQLNTSNINLLTRSDYVLLFSVFYAYKDKLSEDGMKILYEELNSTNATAIAGSGADYSSVNIKKFLKYVDKIVYTKT